MKIKLATIFFTFLYSNIVCADITDSSTSEQRWHGFYMSAGSSAFQNKLTTYSNNSYNGDDTSQTVVDKNKKSFGALQIGYNWQIDSYIFGLESDVGSATLNKTSCRGSRDPATPCADYYYGTLNLTGETKYKGALLGKIGYEVSNFMFYVTGGVVALKVSNILNVDCPSGCGATDANAITSTTTVSRNKLVTAYGLGGEYFLDKNWRLGLDYLFFKTPDLSQSLTHTATYGPQVITSTNSTHNSLLRVKLIYSF